MTLPAYPHHLVRQHRLFDGRSVTIRPISSDDGDRVRNFLNASSEEARYKRFQKWVHAPSNNLVHFLTDIDYDRHLAFVCTVAHANSEEIVGEARYIANSDGPSCEFGVMIDDAWRKTGIAGLLMEALIRASRERGFATMEGLVLRSNLAMQRFAHALGFEVLPIEGERTMLRIRLDLRSEPVRIGAGANPAPPRGDRAARPGG
jgi:acetyltransferase